MRKLLTDAGTIGRDILAKGAAKAAERVARIRKEHGFSTRPWEERTRVGACSQMSLSWNGGAAKRGLEQIQSCSLSKAS